MSEVFARPQAGAETRKPYRRITSCRVCGGASFAPVLDLGEQYIGNAFHPVDDPPTLVAPLELVRCTECSMVQLQHSVDTSLMYSSYWYRSGVNQTMRAHGYSRGARGRTSTAIIGG